MRILLGSSDVVEYFAEFGGDDININYVRVLNEDLEDITADLSSKQLEDIRVQCVLSLTPRKGIYDDVDFSTF